MLFSLKNHVHTLVMRLARPLNMDIRSEKVRTANNRQYIATLCKHGLDQISLSTVSDAVIPQHIIITKEKNGSNNTVRK